MTGDPRTEARAGLQGPDESALLHGGAVDALLLASCPIDRPGPSAGRVLHLVKKALEASWGLEDLNLRPLARRA